MRPSYKVTLRFVLNFYDAFLRETDIDKVSEALGIKGSTGILCDLIKRKKCLQLAKKIADERRDNQYDFPKYVLGNISPEAKKIWKKIRKWANPRYLTTPGAMRNAGHKLKQEIFLMAVVYKSSYNISLACRVAGVSRQTMQAWERDDTEFALLLREIQRHKKDFFEHALMDLVRTGYPGAIIFANRTQNADRGYNEKLMIQHSGSVSAGLNINELDLDFETRKKILDAMRRKRALEKPANAAGIVDVEEVKALPPIPIAA